MLGLLFFPCVIFATFAEWLCRSMPFASTVGLYVAFAVFAPLWYFHCRALQNPMIRNEPASIALVRS